MRSIKNLVGGLMLCTGLLCGARSVQAQDESDSIDSESPVVVYSFFVNVVPHQFKFPLIGLINVCKGDYSGAQIGVLNVNQKSLKGAQIGFCNYVGTETKGVQIGFVNTNLKDFQGLQMGFVNSTIRTFKGLQLGFVNTSTRAHKGGQIGFINTVIGGPTKGLQLGFVNYSDTLTSGVPIGFFSIVKKGGYRAFELSLSEAAPLNFAFKMGVSKFYNSFMIGLIPGAEQNLIVGLGIGSIMSITPSLYFNPEISSINAVVNGNQQFSSLRLDFGYLFHSSLSIVAGPSVCFQNAWENGVLRTPFFQFATYVIDENKQFLIGGKLGLRVQL